MTKVDSLIKALEYCLSDDMDHDLCKNCPYNHYIACDIILMQDSLEIIKEYKNNIKERKKMTEWEKVTRGLESIWKCISPVSHTCADCPYQDNRVECKRRVITDALALLKEQKARLLTLEEVEKNEEWMWVECISGYCGWNRQDKEDNYSCMIAWNDNTVNRKDYYGKSWRCWSSRPSLEQMRNTKWEEVI